jgi:hypothetical protein
MEFDWNNPPFNLDSSLTLQEIERIVRGRFRDTLLPDSPRFSTQNQVLSTWACPVAAPESLVSIAPTEASPSYPCSPFPAEERFFYQRKLDQALALIGSEVASRLRQVRRVKSVV